MNTDMAVGVTIVRGPYCGKCGYDFPVTQEPCDHKTPCIAGVHFRSTDGGRHECPPDDTGESRK